MTIHREPRPSYAGTIVALLVLIFIGGICLVVQRCAIDDERVKCRHAELEAANTRERNHAANERIVRLNDEIARLKKEIQRQVDARLAVHHECDFREAENDRLFRLLEQRLSDVPPPMEIDILQPLENTEVPPPVPDLIPEKPVAVIPAKPSICGCGCGKIECKCVCRNLGPTVKIMPKHKGTP